MRKMIVALAAMFFLVALTTSVVAQTGGDDLAPVYMATVDGIEDSYIVVLKAKPGETSSNGLVDTMSDRATAIGAKVKHEYQHAIVGFSATMSADMVEALRADPAVDHIEQGTVVRLEADQAYPPSWGLDRIDEASRPLDNEYSYEQTGLGVDVYVLDTGIRRTHQEFGGRVARGANFVGDFGSGGDCNGHGTHVAGTIGGVGTGVAKQVNLIPVRVFDCGGKTTTFALVAGMDWVTAKASGPSIANVSLGSAVTPTTNRAAERMLSAGVIVVAAAGNNQIDACLRSPGSVRDVITVAATDSNDRRRRTSNFGRCVDLFAPGDRIVSLSSSNNIGYRAESGTSMAAPHVSGVAALYLEENPGASVAQVTNAILGNATPLTVTDARGSHNLLLNSDFLFRKRPPSVSLRGSSTLSWIR